MRQLKLIREDKLANSAIETMLDSFDEQDDPYIGPFWYDPYKKEIYGNIMTLAKDRPFHYSKQWDTEIRTGSALHKDIWKKEQLKAKPNPRFTGNYTLKPRGRVFEVKDKGFKVFVGDWIDNYPEAKQEIIDTFQLPEDTEFIKDVHWNIGHGWSEEFL